MVLEFLCGFFAKGANSLKFASKSCVISSAVVCFVYASIA